MKNLIVLLAVSGVISACSSASTRPGSYACPLNTSDPSAPCASIQDAYSASNKVAPNPGYKVQSVFDHNAKQRSDSSATALGTNPKGYFANGAQPVPTVGSQEGNPIFRQPKAMKAWTAPYVDADGKLHSGEYTYFNTPPQWNYGTLKQKGSAGSVYGPADPSNLGFDPSMAPNATQQSARQRGNAPTPASNAAAKSVATPALPTADAIRGTGSSASDSQITQPYQRLAD